MLFMLPSPPPSSPLAIEPISMRIPDACRFTGISRSTLYLLIARGEVEIVKMGAATLVLTESLRDLIERQRGGQLSRTAIPIRHQPPGKSEQTVPDHRSRGRHPTAQLGTMPLFEEN
jgi:excisionase family DNA binding protein